MSKNTRSAQGVMMNTSDVKAGDCFSNTRFFKQFWGAPLELEPEANQILIRKDIHAIYVGAHSTHDAYIIETVRPQATITNVFPPNQDAIIVSVRAPYIGCLPAGTYFIRPLRPLDSQNAGIADASSDFNMYRRNAGERTIIGVGPIVSVSTGHLEFVHNMDGMTLPVARPPHNVSFRLGSYADGKALWIHAGGRRRIEIAFNIQSTITANMTFDAVHMQYVAGTVTPHIKNLLTIVLGVGLDDQYEYDSMSDYYLLRCAGIVGSNDFALTAHDF